MSDRTETGSPTTETSLWERGLEYAADYGAYFTLGLGSVLVLLGPQPGQSYLITAGFAVLALVWVYGMFTQAAKRGANQWWFRVYFLGLLGIATAMLLHHPMFLIFPVAAFFQVHRLKPILVTFLGVFATSLVVNILIIAENPVAETIWIYVTVVVIQTLAIGTGVIGGEKLAELSEERRQAVIAHERALEENEGLHAQLVAQAREAGVTDERQRMAREIHDTIAQGLVGIVTQLEAADNVIEDRDGLRRHLGSATRIARESLAEARRAVRAAVPLPLEGRSLPEAIGEVVRGWTADNDVPIEWSTTGTPLVLHPEVEVTLLRVVQESLSNVARHANAGRVGVTLSYMGDVVSVDVRDDGVGFVPNGRNRSGFGLTSMKTRVEELHGSFQVEAEFENGTAVSATLPYERLRDE